MTEGILSTAAEDEPPPPPQPLDEADAGALQELRPLLAFVGDFDEVPRARLGLGVGVDA